MVGFQGILVCHFLILFGLFSVVVIGCTVDYANYRLGDVFSGYCGIMGNVQTCNKTGWLETRDIYNTKYHHILATFKCKNLCENHVGDLHIYKIIFLHGCLDNLPVKGIELDKFYEWMIAILPLISFDYF